MYCCKNTYVFVVCMCFLPTFFNCLLTQLQKEIEISRSSKSNTRFWKIRENNLMKFMFFFFLGRILNPPNYLYCCKNMHVFVVCMCSFLTFYIWLVQQTYLCLPSQSIHSHSIFSFSRLGTYYGIILPEFWVKLCNFCKISHLFHKTQVLIVFWFAQQTYPCLPL